MRNKYFLIWCISVFALCTIGEYLNFISGFTLWVQGEYSDEVRAMTALFNMICAIFIGHLFYEPKEIK